MFRKILTQRTAGSQETMGKREPETYVEKIRRLEDVLESADKDDAAKKEAVEKAAEIAQNIEQETNIENLVKAKGFKDCVAFIQNGECSIVVLTDGLLDSEAITIKDIVLGQSGIGYDKIKIVESK